MTYQAAATLTTKCCCSSLLDQQGSRPLLSDGHVYPSIHGLLRQETQQMGSAANSHHQTLLQDMAAARHFVRHSL